VTKEQAEFLAEACEASGVECDIHDDYSGRGMYGKTTYAVVVNNPLQLLGAVVAYVKAIWDAGEDLSEVPALDRLEEDVMGRDVIIY
jgi:hypothetical protein